MENLNKKPANVVRYNEQNKDKNVHICLNVETHKGFNTFEGCVASGASAHMCNDEKYFIKLNKWKLNSVALADGSNLLIQGVDTVKFKTAESNKQLEDVHFVPGL